MRTWRTINIYKDKGLSGDSAKETFALPRTHMISDLWLAVRNTNASGGNQCDNVALETIEKSITNIAIKSGSKTFKSYSGQMCRLMGAAHDGRLAPQKYDSGDGVEQETVFHIPFGLEPQDEDVILPAPLLDSLDLVLDYTFSVAGSGVGYVTSSAEFDLYAQVLEPTADLEDKMILVQDKKRDFTAAASGETPFDLTLDERRLLRKVYIEAYVHSQAEGYVISNLKLKADNEEVIDMKWRNLQFQNAMDAKLNYYQRLKHEQTGAGDVLRTRIPDVRPMGEADDGTDGGITVSGDAVTITTGGDGGVMELEFHSDVLPTVAILDFDRDNSMRRLQPQGIRDLDVIVEDAHAGACAIYEESLQKIW